MPNDSSAAASLAPAGTDCAGSTAKCDSPMRLSMSLMTARSALSDAARAARGRSSRRTWRPVDTRNATVLERGSRPYATRNRTSRSPARIRPAREIRYRSHGEARRRPQCRGMAVGTSVSTARAACSRIARRARRSTRGRKRYIANRRGNAREGRAGARRTYGMVRQRAVSREGRAIRACRSRSAHHLPHGRELCARSPARRVTARPPRASNC